MARPTPTAIKPLAAVVAREPGPDSQDRLRRAIDLVLAVGHPKAGEPTAAPACHGDPSTE